MTKRELRQKDQVISPLIEQGQSPYHILVNHPELDMSLRTLYSHLDQGFFTARSVDLKRKLRFKPRKCHKTQITDWAVFTNRLYSDFCNLALPSHVEMGTVHSSRRSKKTLLTLFFTKEKLFLAFLMIRCTEGAVRLGFDRLKKRMGTYEFASVFEYILTDRARNSEIRSHWKLVCVEYNVPAFIIVALCRADRKVGWNRHTPCFGWFSQKEPALSFLPNGM